MVGKEEDDGVLIFAGFFEGAENLTEAVVGTTNGGVVLGEFGADSGIIEQEPGDGDFIGCEDATGDMRIGFAAFGVEGFVGIGDIDIEAEGFLSGFGLGDAGLVGEEVGGGVFGVGGFAVGQGVQNSVPGGVGVIGGGVGDLAADSGEITGGLHEVGEMRVVGVFDLVKTFDAGGVGVATGPHDIAGGHAVADLDKGVEEAQALRGEAVHLRSGVWQSATVNADGVTTHVIGGDEEEVGFGCGGEGGEGEPQADQNEGKGFHRALKRRPGWRPCAGFKRTGHTAALNCDRWPVEKEDWVRRG